MYGGRDRGQGTFDLQTLTDQRPLLGKLSLIFFLFRRKAVGHDVEVVTEVRKFCRKRQPSSTRYSEVALQRSLKVRQPRYLLVSEDKFARPKSNLTVFCCPGGKLSFNHNTCMIYSSKSAVKVARCEIIWEGLTGGTESCLQSSVGQTLQT